MHFLSHHTLCHAYALKVNEKQICFNLLYRIPMILYKRETEEELLTFDFLRKDDMIELESECHWFVNSII